MIQVKSFLMQAASWLMTNGPRRAVTASMVALTGIALFMANAAPTYAAPAPGMAPAVGGAYVAGINWSIVQSLTIDLDTTQLFAGAQLIINALSGPYLLLAGLGLGVAILATIVKVVRTIRL